MAEVMRHEAGVITCPRGEQSVEERFAVEIFDRKTDVPHLRTVARICAQGTCNESAVGLTDVATASRRACG